MYHHTLGIETRGKRDLVMTRRFNAGKELVFRALTEPHLVKRWLLGPEGWVLKTCEIDLRVGGAYRYVWQHAGRGDEMGMGGTYLDIDRPDRIVHSEIFDQSWYPGTAVVTTRLSEADGVTTFEATITYESEEARNIVAASPMREGAGASYDRLDGVLEDLAAETAG
ncbi:SRPBCC family protein [Maricaulis sp.]|uniref:SRPBCC family protein n=1 Tax=Maricaulis sp. TaxID=1486257 RepID=UPI00260A8DCC|nr:SRPBCC family protein [Maricaulis sp.]